MSKIKKINKEDKGLMNELESSELEFVSGKDEEQLDKILTKSAKNTLQKKKVINIRISERDLLRLKVKANEEGLPYQSLISSLLHKYLY